MDELLVALFWLGLHRWMLSGMPAERRYTFDPEPDVEQREVRK